MVLNITFIGCDGKVPRCKVLDFVGDFCLKILVLEVEWGGLVYGRLTHSAWQSSHFNPVDMPPSDTGEFIGKTAGVSWPSGHYSPSLPNRSQSTDWNTEPAGAWGRAGWRNGENCWWVWCWAWADRCAQHLRRGRCVRSELSTLCSVRDLLCLSEICYAWVVHILCCAWDLLCLSCPHSVFCVRFVMHELSTFCVLCEICYAWVVHILCCVWDLLCVSCPHFVLCVGFVVLELSTFCVVCGICYAWVVYILCCVWDL